MCNAVIVWSVVPILMASPAFAGASKLAGGDIFISRDSSKDSISYATSRAEVRVQREDSGQEDGSQYVVEYKDRSRGKISYRYDATPQVELYEVVGLEVTNAFCRRDIAVVTIREYTNIEEPCYLYTRVFLELGQSGKGFDYLDSAATEMGGPTPTRLLEDYATIDCSKIQIELTSE